LIPCGNFKCIRLFYFMMIYGNFNEPIQHLNTF
jgi:hypothetical protein